jgi:DNA repair protein RecN (Recombination protein N)
VTSLRESGANMLRHLSIRNFAIVESLDLDFQPGFTALTGETGAGKSILIDALALALGERADAEQVRSGAERAEISAEFSTPRKSPLQDWIAEQALDGDADSVLLRRVVDSSGRSRAFVNGHVATLAQLREAGEYLVDIHGQHAHQSLLRGDSQRHLLDGHAGLNELVSDVGRAYREWQRLAKARAEHETNAAARIAEREQLAWQVEELTKLAPVAGEWESMDQEHSRLAHAASLIEGASSAVDMLSESDSAISESLAEVISNLAGLVQYDRSLGESVELLESASAQIGEAAQTLRRYGDKVDLDPKRLAEVGRRIEALHSASRRFRTTPGELPAYFDQKRARLAELDIATDMAALMQAEESARSSYREIAARLSGARKKAAAKLSRDVTSVMKDLAMKGGTFQVNLVPLAGQGSAAGDEAVEFAVSANAGVEPRALAKVASGGELSRISLALMVITSSAAKVPTMIFDEVDAGIGGAVAEIVGRRLKNLGQNRQVLCVTHLPQVAALADFQWSVAKTGGDDKGAAVASSVTQLDQKARVEEIARMLGGLEITATTRRHAAEMLSAGKA